MQLTSRKRHRPSEFLNGIDSWAFLSTPLVLLIVFIVTPNHPPHGTALELARTNHAAPMHSAVREDAMLITVTRDGHFFYGMHQVRPDDLALAMRDSVEQGSEKKVYLRVDARARYSDAVLVIDQVREAGIQQIGIITEQRQPH
jgi:biopolymer transport protein ExbD